MIHNIRGIGYSPPLRLKDPEKGETTLAPETQEQKLQHFVSILQEYATQSLELSRKCHIIKIDAGFILERKPVHQELETLLSQYEQQITKLHPTLKLHSNDFLMIRLEFTLAKLRKSASI